MQAALQALPESPDAAAAPAQIQLEGIWIEFPPVPPPQADIAAMEPEAPRPQLAIAVSLPWPTPDLPSALATNRIYLKFGDF
ncbi:MAG: hypothetical protein WBG32_08505 [Nodosilinea sp.]